MFFSLEQDRFLRASETSSRPRLIRPHSSARPSHAPDLDIRAGAFVRAFKLLHAWPNPTLRSCTCAGKPAREGGFSHYHRIYYSNTIVEIYDICVSVSTSPLSASSKRAESTDGVKEEKVSGEFKEPLLSWFDGVVGYRICLTHRRSPVRARVESSLHWA